MISFRYHLTTLVAVFLALAVGVVLGGGPLSEWGRNEPQKAAANSGAEARATAAQQQAEAALNGAAPRLYAQGLKGRTVTVLRLPGVSEATVTGVENQIQTAGGTSQTWTLTEGLVGTGDKALVDTLGSQLATQMPEGTVTKGATTYVRMGELMATALASTKKQGEGVTNESTTILESLQTAKLVTGPATAATRAPLVLVLATNPNLSNGGDLIHEGLVTGLAARSGGVVLATTSGADLIDVLREKNVPETVAMGDGVETMAGQMAATTALVRSITTVGGQFGVSGDDGFLLLG